MLQKKYIILTILTSLFLTSCSKNDNLKPIESSTTKPSNNFEEYIPPEVKVKDINITDMDETKMPSRSNILNDAYYYEPTTLASFKATHDFDLMHIANISEGLFDNDSFGRLVPAIAKSIPEINFDKNTGFISFDIYLKNDLHWAKWNDTHTKLVNAGNITAQDFVTAAKLTLLNYKNNPNANLYIKYIEKADEFIDVIDQNINKKDLDKWFSDNVGIKALDDNHLLVRTKSRHKDILTIFTSQSFYPIPTSLYNDSDRYGMIDGSSTIDNIWYCGAFALSDYTKDKISYIKNNLYWDNNHVSLEKINLIKTSKTNMLLNNRSLFEENKIDYLNVPEADTVGYKKYVGEGSDNTLGNPKHKYANAFIQNPDPSIYFMSYNFNRKNRFNYDLDNTNPNYIDDFEKAIKNVNFRKAIFYAMDKSELNSSYYHPNKSEYNANTLTYDGFNNYGESKDYNEYFVEKFAFENNISTDLSRNIISIGRKGVENKDLSKYYLDIALEELGNTVNLPITIEIVANVNEDYNKYYYNFVNKFQHNIDPSKELVKMNILRCTESGMKKSLVENDFSVSIENHVTANYDSPLSILESFNIDGIYAVNSGLTGENEKLLRIYNNMLNDALDYNDYDKYYRTLAQAEYHLIYEEALFIPFTQLRRGVSVVLTKIRPYSNITSNYGISMYKYKSTIVYNELLDKKQFAYCVKKYNNEKQKLNLN